MISYALNANNSVSIYFNNVLVAIYNDCYYARYNPSPEELRLDLIDSLLGRIPSKLIGIVVSNAISIRDTGYVPNIGRA